MRRRYLWSGSLLLIAAVIVMSWQSANHAPTGTANVAGVPPPLPAAAEPVDVPGRPLEAYFGALRAEFLGIDETHLRGRYPLRPDLVCKMFLAGHAACRVDQLEETIESCVERYGGAAWTRALQPQCGGSSWWIRFAAKFPAVPGVDWRQLRDRVTSSVIPRSWPYVPPTERPIAAFADAPPCQNTIQKRRFHNIGFTILASTLVPRVSRLKLWEFMPIVPRNKYSYPMPGKIDVGFAVGPLDELLYFTMQQMSYFAYSHIREGSDCGRHIDIVQNGGVPFFVDIERCMAPHGMCLTGYPRSEYKALLDFPGVAHITTGRKALEPFRNEYLWRFTLNESLTARNVVDPQRKMTKWREEFVNFFKMGDIDRTTFSETKYFATADRLLDFSRKHLVCAALAAYMLDRANKTEPKHVLFVGQVETDYQEQMVEAGLMELGIRYSSRRVANRNEAHIDWARDSPRAYPNAFGGPELIATQNRRYRGYGLGYGWSRRVQRRPEVSDSAMRRAIESKTFDLIIYTERSERPHWDAALKAIGGDNIIVFNGADYVPTSEYVVDILNSGAHLFLREANGLRC